MPPWHSGNISIWLEVGRSAGCERAAAGGCAGAVYTIQRALPLLREGAAIVLTSSMYTALGMPGSSIYTASKAALESLARTLSAELVGRGIRVNAISPGNIRTPLYQRLGMAPSELEAAAAAAVAQVPMQRFGEADELARAVAFLLSPDASYVVGETLFIYHLTLRSGGVWGGFASPRFLFSSRGGA